MSYLVFARKWRPKNFDEVIGQEHIATTLKNAISLKRVAHAYVFCGPRGIGKTSCARILAKALNCEKGPAASPCNVCNNCREISGGASLDVIEIDGASNRGIEQIRQLRENVKFAPAKARFKVYIIDEVHQITTDGFNALLKTLEEPPAHVKFIFATTQAHKVLPTILSRCQRFNFKPLTLAAIMGKLKRIIKEERLDVSEDALVYIGRAASGSMRDAESILDQMVSFHKGQVKLEAVTKVLGIVDLEALWGISQKIIERDTAGALTLIEEIINQGKDLPQFMGSLMEHFRNILVTKISSANADQLIDLPKDYVQRISEQAKGLNFEEIFYIFNVLVRAQESLRRALSSRVIVEVAVVRLTQRGSLCSLEEILARLTNLEQNLKENQVDNPGKNEAGANEEPEAQIQNDSKELNHSWPGLLEALKEEKMFLASSLELGRMTGLDDRGLTIAFPKEYNFYKENLERPENKKIIETKAKQVFGRNVKVKFVLDKHSPVASSGEPGSLEAPKKTPTEPIIQSALKIFQGRIIGRRS